MSEAVFYSVDELKKYLETVPDGEFVKVTVTLGDSEDTGVGNYIQRSAGIGTEGIDFIEKSPHHEERENGQEK